MAASSERGNFLKGMAFLSPWLVGFSVFMALPIALSAYYSVCDYTLVKSPVFCGLENYRDLIHDPTFWKSLRNTVLYAAMALPAGLLLSLAVAIVLNCRVPGQSIFRTIIFIPSLVPTVAAAILWAWMYNTKYGLVNRLLEMVHFGHFRIEGPGWLTDAHWVIPAFALMSLWSIGNTVVIYLAGLQDVPRDLYEAADLDGAGALGRLIHVTLPMISPVIFFNLIMGIIGVLQVFDVPYIIATNGQPDRAAYFLTEYLYDTAFQYLHMGYASAMAWMQLVVILALTALSFWSSRRWVHYQGK